MKRPICVIDVPGLSRELLAYVPAASLLGKWLAQHPVATLLPSWPATTCSVQATLTTGALPSQHGVVANGLATFRSSTDRALIDPSSFFSYRRDVSFWEQSNQLLERPRFWQDSSGRSRYKTALLFFQNSMPGFSGVPRPAADIVVTPKPEHDPDGGITSLLWTDPPDLAPRLSEQFGPFPLIHYWGPRASIESSQWIAKCAAWIWQTLRPQLQLTYIPHLDYDLQRFGPDSPQAQRAVAEAATAMEPLIDTALSIGQLVLLSEYSMQRANRSVPVNRLFADAGLLVTRETPDGKLVDYDRSEAFAMVDHQIAHVYVRQAAVDKVRAVLSAQPLGEVPTTQRITHPRAGELQLEAHPGAWFEYRWWSDSSLAPVFARSVDIHRKPGYDPLELFFDPATRSTAQDASLVRGTHGRLDGSAGIVVGFDCTHRNVKATELADLLQQLL